MVQHDSCAVDCACEESSGGCVVEITGSGDWLVGIVCEKVVGVLLKYLFEERREREREMYKMGIYPCVDLLHPSGKIRLFKFKGVGEFGMTDCS